MPHVAANGIEIYVESHGDPAATPLVLVRGLGSQIIHWPAAMLERFVAGGFFVVTADNRDAGLSQKFDDWGPIDEDELQRRIDEGLPIQSPYTATAFGDDQCGFRLGRKHRGRRKGDGKQPKQRKQFLH